MTTVDITAVSKLKHADLWEAAKKMGSMAALARHLGIGHGLLCRYCSLMAAPNVDRWPEEKRADIERKLFELTGKTLAEIWPTVLREAMKFLAAPKQFESRKSFEADALLAYAEATRDRLTNMPTAETVVNAEELRKDITKAIGSTLNYREREVLKLRFGIGDGYCYTLEEVGHIFKVTKDRIRQIEAKALDKLKRSRHIVALVQHVD